MTELVQVALPRDFFGQILDGLESLIEQWQITAEYMDTGYCRDDSIGIRECSDAAEAGKIAAYYIRIRDQLAAQLLK